MSVFCVFFFFQAEDGIRDLTVTGVQTCALPISLPARHAGDSAGCARPHRRLPEPARAAADRWSAPHRAARAGPLHGPGAEDRKSTRLNSSHSQISYAVFCLKKKIMVTLHEVITFLVSMQIS